MQCTISWFDIWKGKTVSIGALTHSFCLQNVPQSKNTKKKKKMLMASKWCWAWYPDLHPTGYMRTCCLYLTFPFTWINLDLSNLFTAEVHVVKMMKLRKRKILENKVGLLNLVLLCGQHSNSADWFRYCLRKKYSSVWRVSNKLRNENDSGRMRETDVMMKSCRSKIKLTFL